MDVPLSEEDRVIYLLASLPDSFSVLVTALEASSDVPKMDIVIERLLHQERKLNDRSRSSVDAEKAMSVEKSRQGPKKRIGPCHYCGRMGHFRRDCWELSKLKDKKSEKHNARNVTEAVSSDEDALLTSHVLVGMSTGWIV